MVDKGQKGYIKYTKSRLILKGSLCMLGVVVLFILSELIDISIIRYLKVFSALMILPAALFMSNYFAYVGYKELEETAINKLEAIQGQSKILYEMVLVNKKLTKYFPLIILNENDVIAYYKVKKGDHLEDEYKVIQAIISEAELTAHVKVFTHINPIIDYLTAIPSDGSIDLQKLETIEKALLMQSI